MKAAIIAGCVVLSVLGVSGAHADQAQIDICKKRFDAGELQPGDEIGACYAKATNNRCDGDLDGARAEVCADWVSTQAFWQCVEERRIGKVKHCYRNDPRWRD
jgi:hypothetical protein